MPNPLHSNAVFTFYVAFALTVLALLLCFIPFFGGLWSAWQTEQYSHGILIPVLAALIGWHRLVEKKPNPAPSWTGVALLLVGFSFLTLSQLAAFEPPAHYGFVVCLSGIILAFFGWRTLWILLPALVYLVFSIPLPRLIEVALTAEMQMMSTNLGVAILKAIGVSVYQDGNIIDLGVHKLQVVEACSGLRYLFPLMSFGFLIAFMFQGAMWKRVFIFLFTIPLTLGMNSLRISITGIMVNWGGSAMAEGLVHMVEGWFIFVLCILTLLSVTWIVSKIGKTRGHMRFDYFTLPQGMLFPGEPYMKAAAFGALVLCLATSPTLILSSLNEREEIVPPRTSLAFFPITLGEWTGQRSPLESETLDVLQMSDYWNADYKRREGEPPVNLYMAYYSSQRVGVSAHSPANCIPAGGWVVDEQKVIPVALKNQTIPVTRMIIRKQKEALIVYYWFDQRGHIMNSQYAAKWYLLVDSITRHRTDGGIVRLLTPLAHGEDEASADARIQNLMRVMAPLTHLYVPQ